VQIGSVDGWEIAGHIPQRDRPIGQAGRDNGRWRITTHIAAIDYSPQTADGEQHLSDP
jgi:hypothetical protein